MLQRAIGTEITPTVSQIIASDTGFHYSLSMNFLSKNRDTPKLVQLRKNAESLFAARIKARSLASFPGVLPDTLEEAYLSQDHAIALKHAAVVGWKVGFIAPERRDESADERVLGPIFADQLAFANDGDRLTWKFIPGGFAAVEAEYVFKIGRDLTNALAHASDQALAECVASVHLGVELAGSPLRDINKIGPLAVASDFGNNNGLILGPALPIQSAELFDPKTWTAMMAKCLINGHVIGNGGGAQIPGTPWQAFRFAAQRVLRRGYQLHENSLIATGASTGIHEVQKGDKTELCFWLANKPNQINRIYCDIDWRPVE
jgi:2-keto-4-pentenoate hydratase